MLYFWTPTGILDEYSSLSRVDLEERHQTANRDLETANETVDQLRKQVVNNTLGTKYLDEPKIWTNQNWRRNIRRLTILKIFLFFRDFISK